jgi:hypothetical protein
MAVPSDDRFRRSTTACHRFDTLVNGPGETPPTSARLRQNLPHGSHGYRAHHGDDPVTKEDAEDVRRLAEQFLNVLYVVPAIAQSAKRPQKRGKKLAPMLCSRCAGTRCHRLPRHRAGSTPRGRLP